MKRSGWVTGVIVVQFVCGAVLFGTCVLLLFLMRRPEASQGAPNPGASVQALKLAVAILTPLALVTVVGAWELAKRRLWGWWLALLTDLGLLAIFVYSMIDHGPSNIDWDMFGFTAGTFVLVAWLLVPSVRRFYWANAAGSGPTQNAGTGARL